LKDKALRRAVCKDMRKRGNQNKLHGFEQAKNLVFCDTPFLEITDPEKIVTDTMKLKRH